MHACDAATSGGPAASANDGGFARWPYRRHYAVLAGLFLLFAAYGSLVPLPSESKSLAAAARQFAALVDQPMPRYSRTDIAVNVLLFVPIGYFLLGAAVVDRPGRLRKLAAAVVIWTGCAAASLLIEFAQLWVPERTSSMYDVGCQWIGTTAGMAGWLLCGMPLTLWLRESSRTLRSGDYFDWLLRLYVVLLLLYPLRHLDLATSPVELVRKYRQGLIVLSPLQSGREVGTMRLVYEAVSDFLCFVPLGMLATTALTTRRRPLRSLATAMLLGVAMVCAIRGVHLLVLSYPWRAWSLLTGSLGAAAGVGLMHAWRGAALRGDQAAPAGSRRIWMLSIAAAGYAVFLVWFFCFPFDIIRDQAVLKERLLGLFRAPLSSLYYSRIDVAARELVRKTALFAPLGVLLALAIGRRTASRITRRVLSIAAGSAVAALAVGIELLQVFTAGHVPDLTDSALYAAGALAALALTSRYAIRTPANRP